MSKPSVYRYIRSFEQTGDVKPRSYPPKLIGQLEQVILLRIISSNPGIYLSEIQSMLIAKFGVHIHKSTICRTLKYMDCTHKLCEELLCDVVMLLELGLWHRYLHMTQSCFG
jgi:transposase